MNQAAEEQIPVGAERPLDNQRNRFEGQQDDNASSLAGTLLAIQQRRGMLFMLETSRYLIEKWDLRSDRLRTQTQETLDLVARLLRQ